MYQKENSPITQTMVNPGTFQGARFQFLLIQKPEYATAVVVNGVEDPSHNFLANVDDDKPDVQPHAPDEDALSPEEYADAVRKFEARSVLVSSHCKVSGPGLCHK